MKTNMKLANEVNEAIEAIEAIVAVEPTAEVIHEATVEAQEVAAVEVKKVDITSIIKALPTTVTPATIDILYQFNDSGKTVRRHLRKYYAEGHEKLAKWGWSKEDKALAAIIEYFTSKYTAHIEKLAIAK